jgi:hypothetical protein
MSQIEMASVSFALHASTVDPSVGRRSETSDNLRILVSTNCGESYDNVVFTEQVLARISDVGAPSEVQWDQHTIDLSPFAGKSGVRVAWVLETSGSYELYVDNIEFFRSNNSNSVRPDGLFAIYDTDPAGSQSFKITFNLDDRQQVQYAFIDMTGKILNAGTLIDVLNQTYEMSPDLCSGIYIFRLQIGNSSYAAKIAINR